MICKKYLNQSIIIQHKLGIAERNVVKKSMQIVTVYFGLCKDYNNNMEIKCDLYDHDGKCLFENGCRFIGTYNELSIELGEKIIKDVGQQKINQLNILEDDFDYTPSLRQIN